MFLENFETSIKQIESYLNIYTSLFPDIVLNHLHTLEDIMSLEDIMYDTTISFSTCILYMDIKTLEVIQISVV